MLKFSCLLQGRRGSNSGDYGKRRFVSCKLQRICL